MVKVGWNEVFFWVSEGFYGIIVIMVKDEVMKCV